MERDSVAATVDPSTDAAPATQTAQPELPVLPAAPSTLIGRLHDAPPSLTADARPSPLDDLVDRAVEGARREGSGRAVANAVALVLGAVLALRVIFDDVLPKLLMVAVLGGAVLAAVALVARAALESRRQKALLAVFEQLTRLAQHDAAMRDRVAPQLDAVVDALRAPTPLLPPFSRKG